VTLPSQKLYSIIVLCYNHLDITKRCLDALFQTDLSQAELIVVDNHSTDDTWEYLHSLMHRIDLIYRCEENLGVGGGYNVGFAFVHTPYFLTLNNDMLIYDVDWLEKMHAPFKNLKVAQVGIEETGCWLDNQGVGWYLPHSSLKPDYVETCCMMGRTDAVREVGPLFDPIYKMCYCEDSDLSLRLRAKGWEIAHIPMNYEHIGHVTLGAGDNPMAAKYLVPNLVTFKKRWRKYLDTRKF
jgi:GT2 family glycosyltransferase